MNIQRRGRRADAAHTPIQQLPFRQPQHTLEPSRILSDDQIEAIHRQSLKVLEEIGMDILHEEARDILKKAGARISGERVRIGRDIIEEALKTPPSEFTFHARNPAHNIRVGGKWIAFAPVGGPPQLFRPRPGPQARHAGGCGQLREARAVLQYGSHGGRGLGRCTRRARLGAAPSHHPQQDGPF